MEITFLGTASGTPTKTRNVSAIALKESQGSHWYLIDCGEGTQHQLLKTSYSLNTLSAIFITHIHGDHCYGLPGLLASAGMSSRQTPLTIVAPQGIREWFESTLRHTSLYLPFPINFVATEQLQNQQLGGFVINAAPLSHRVPSFAYSFVEAKVDSSLNIPRLKAAGIPQGPLWGKLKSGSDVEYQGKIHRSEDFVTHDKAPRKIVICGDNDQPALLKEACRDCHVLIHESTFTHDMAERAQQVGHSYAHLVASFAQEAKLPALILTHFSARYALNGADGYSIETMQQEAQASYSGTLYMANDFDCFTVNKQGEICLT